MRTPRSDQKYLINDCHARIIEHVIHSIVTCWMNTIPQTLSRARVQKGAGHETMAPHISRQESMYLLRERLAVVHIKIVIIEVNHILITRESPGTPPMDIGGGSGVHAHYPWELGGKLETLGPNCTRIQLGLHYQEYINKSVQP